MKSVSIASKEFFCMGITIDACINLNCPFEIYCNDGDWAHRKDEVKVTYKGNEVVEVERV